MSPMTGENKAQTKQISDTKGDLLQQLFTSPLGKEQLGSQIRKIRFFCQYASRIGSASANLSSLPWRLPLFVP